ncbi:hypothetical protein BGX28_002920 [Mortierella sp. GBA30]|nr:hypothetical protein BGX28_002920 [Mortierella sp. GBA30]
MASTQYHKYPFARTFGLRHKPSIDWGMRARARRQMHWDEYWGGLETAQGSDAVLESDPDPLPNPDHKPDALHMDITHSNSTIVSAKNDLQLRIETVVKGDRTYNATEEANSMSEGPVDDPSPSSSSGYFFPQLLDHFSERSSTASNTTFQQYYRINAEFYKPGGPIILWLPGESPLHSLFLLRGLSYELANATSGLLVALEHRFYGNSIPRFQDSHRPGTGNEPSDSIKEEWTEDNFEGRADGVGSWGTASVAQSNPKARNVPFLNGHNNDSSTNSSRSSNMCDEVHCDKNARAPYVNNDGGEDDGLPLDLLKYLTVDQSIDDIAYFMDNFSLALARDFLDGALQMTDDFMKQMMILDSRKSGNGKTILDATTNESILAFEEKDPSSHDGARLPFSSASVAYQKQWSKEERRAAKLKILTWFSTDFASEYAVDGEEVHAAGWIWWTVASAVQYNAVVSPPTRKPSKTVVDVLCDTMTLGLSHGKDNILEYDQYADTDAETQEPLDPLTCTEEDPLRAVRFAKALAGWFRNQQFFTPTRYEDLLPSDTDPSSAQNLASLAWLWQTCSELGYLQTAQPSEYYPARNERLDIAVDINGYSSAEKIHNKPLSSGTGSRSTSSESTLSRNNDSVRRKVPRPSGRYYFTNGENDPWRALTLASPEAINFLEKGRHGHRAEAKKQGRRRCRVGATAVVLENTSTKNEQELTTNLTALLQSPNLSRPIEAESKILKYRVRRHCYQYNHRRLSYHRRVLQGQRLTKADKNITLDSTSLPRSASVVNKDNQRGTERDVNTSGMLSPMDERQNEDQETDRMEPGIEGDEHYGAHGRHGDGNVLRIIPRASHCQDILYESSDLDSTELREERQHVLKTFVRWIETDIKRQERIGRRIKRPFEKQG